MNLFGMFGNIYFSSFEDVVEFMCSYAPVWILTVFAVNCIFSIFDDIFHIGGKR